MGIRDRPWAWQSSWPSTGIAARRSSTSTTPCANSRRSRAAPVFDPLIPSVSPLLAAAAVGGAAPDSLINFVPLIPAIPLAGFVFTAFFGRRMGRPAFVLPLLGVTATWLLSMAVVYQALTGGFGEHGAGITLWRCFSAGAFNVDIGFFVDELTACRLFVVTPTGLLVHLGSGRYMAPD